MRWPSSLGFLYIKGIVGREKRKADKKRALGRKEKDAEVKRIKNYDFDATSNVVLTLSFFQSVSTKLLLNREPTVPKVKHVKTDSVFHLRTVYCSLITYVLRTKSINIRKTCRSHSHLTAYLDSIRNSLKDFPFQ